MLKEKLKKIGKYALMAVPLFAHIVSGMVDYYSAKHIDGYSIRQNNTQTIIYHDMDNSGNTIPILTRLIDNNNDGILDEKITSIAFPRKGILTANKNITEKDQEIYKGLLAKL